MHDRWTSTSHQCYPLLADMQAPIVALSSFMRPPLPVHAAAEGLKCMRAAAGVVNGMQSSLQNLLQSLSYAVGLAVWQPQLFIGLMVGSVLVVSFACLLYLHFAGALQWVSDRLERTREYQPMHSGQSEQA